MNSYYTSHYESPRAAYKAAFKALRVFTSMYVVAVIQGDNTYTLIQRTDTCIIHVRSSYRPK